MTCLINTNIFDSISMYSNVYLLYCMQTKHESNVIRAKLCTQQQIPNKHSHQKLLSNNKMSCYSC